ncbi:MAG TPA: hypothetical protein VK450_02075, partial [Methanomicrobiales archaeon]|nr:hypothetical protein [Methanomicrobiales archaeon]
MRAIGGDSHGNVHMSRRRALSLIAGLLLLACLVQAAVADTGAAGDGTGPQGVITPTPVVTPTLAPAVNDSATGTPAITPVPDPTPGVTVEPAVTAAAPATQPVVTEIPIVVPTGTPEPVVTEPPHAAAMEATGLALPSEDFSRYLSIVNRAKSPVVQAGYSTGYIPPALDLSHLKGKNVVWAAVDAEAEESGTDL